MKRLLDTILDTFNLRECLAWTRNGIFGYLGFQIAIPLMKKIQHVLNVVF